MTGDPVGKRKLILMLAAAVFLLGCTTGSSQYLISLLCNVAVSSSFPKFDFYILKARMEHFDHLVRPWTT